MIINIFLWELMVSMILYLIMETQIPYHKPKAGLNLYKWVRTLLKVILDYRDFLG